MMRFRPKSWAYRFSGKSRCSGTVAFDANSGTVGVEAAYTALLGDATGATLNFPAGAGELLPTWLDLETDGGSFGTFYGDGRLSVGQLRLLLERQASLTVKSTEYLGGEIEGRIGFGPGSDCDADVNGDGLIDEGDVLDLVILWGDCADCPADLNGDNRIDNIDLAQVMAEWGTCP